MIEYLIIENYQPYKKVVFHFSKGVNAIIGGTDDGKSSIMRAILTILENDKSTLRFRNKLCKKKEAYIVNITTSWGDIIERKRSEIENIYTLNGHEFKAFGQGVPNEIKKALNLQDINIKTQFKDNFLIANSPPEVARYLNRLVNLELIDKAFSNINKKKKSNKQNIDYNKGILKEFIQKFKEFDKLDIIEKDIQKINGMSKNIGHKEQKLMLIKDKVNSVNVILEKISLFPNLELIVEKINILKNTSDIFDKKYNMINRIFNITNEGLIIQKKLKKIPTKNVLENVSKKLDNIKSKTYKIKEKEDLYFILIGKITRSKNILDQINKMPDMKGISRSIIRIKMNLKSFDELVEKRSKLIKLVNDSEDILLEKDGVKGSLSVIIEELKKVPRCDKCGQFLIKGLDKCQ